MDLKEKNDQDLEKLLLEKRNALRNFRFNTSSSKLKNVKEGKTVRKDIARVLTEITMRKKAVAK